MNEQTETSAPRVEERCPECDSVHKDVRFEVDTRRQWCDDVWHDSVAAQPAMPPQPTGKLFSKLSRAIRTAKFTREEFPIPCGFPSEIYDQIDQLLRDELGAAMPPQESANEEMPGPWSYSGDEDGDFVIWGPGDDNFVANVDQESFGPVPPSKIAFDLNQANAKLIVAAVNAYRAASRPQDSTQEPRSFCGKSVGPSHFCILPPRHIGNCIGHLSGKIGAAVPAQDERAEQVARIAAEKMWEVRNGLSSARDSTDLHPQKELWIAATVDNLLGAARASSTKESE